MAETLGSLCDKLTVVKLKHYHTDDEEKIRSLAEQEKQLCEEIDTYLNDAIAGKILIEKLTFSPNKVYYKLGNEVKALSDKVGTMLSNLSLVNCKLWHIQEKVYVFKEIDPTEKDEVIHQLSVLNLERNQYIDEIDKQFKRLIQYMRR